MNLSDPENQAPGATAGPPTEREQLEAARRTGAITPELFAALVARLPAPTPLPPAHAESARPAPAGSSAFSENSELPSLLSLFEPPAAALAPRPPTPTATPVAHVAATPVPTVEAIPTARPAPQFLPERPAAAPEPPARPLPAPVPGPVAPALPRSQAAPPSLAAAEAGGAGTAQASALAPRRGALTAALAGLGGLALLGVMAYLYVDRAHPDERLSGPQPAPIETVEPAEARTSPPAPETGPLPAPEPPRPVLAAPDSATQPSEAVQEPEAAQEPETAPTAPQTQPAPTETDEPAAPRSAANAPAPVPAAPEPGDDEAAQKIRTVLADYYADLFAPPLAAEKYFAPQVERLYIQQNLTPAQINATITQTFFPDSKRAVYQVEPGTLRVSDPAQDGSRTATYSEACRLFRASKGRYQRLRTQVRVKFDADYRITFLRQEKMLENVFE